MRPRAHFCAQNSPHPANARGTEPCGSPAHMTDGFVASIAVQSFTTHPPPWPAHPRSPEVDSSALLSTRTPHASPHHRAHAAAAQVRHQGEAIWNRPTERRRSEVRRIPNCATAGGEGWGRFLNIGAVSISIRQARHHHISASDSRTSRPHQCATCVHSNERTSHAQRPIRTTEQHRINSPSDRLRCSHSRQVRPSPATFRDVLGVAQRNTRTVTK